VRMRMILKSKKDGRKKGRLVLQGFMEPRWWNTGAIDAPVVASPTVKTILFMAGVPEDVISSVDIDVAFLQADEFPESEQTRYASYKSHPLADTQYYAMRGPIYGSKDAAMRFYTTIAPWLCEHMGFSVCANDPGAFYNSGTGVRVGIHVDDIILRGTPAASAQFYTDLAKRFQLKDPEYLTPDTPLIFLGMKISMAYVDGVAQYYIDCADGTREVVDTFPIGPTRHVKCPMPDTSELLELGPLTLEHGQIYRSTVGSIQFLVQVSRFDLAIAASRLAQFNSNPTAGAWKALRRVVAYMAATLDFKIGGPRARHDKYETHSDSDHAGDRKRTTKSQSGTIILLNDIPVYWRSGKQCDTSVSAAEAEITALYEGCTQARLCQYRAEELGMNTSWPCRVWVDNRQALSFSENTCVHSRLRGVFDLRDARVTELRDKNKIKVQWVERNNNHADMLTHCMNSGPFNKAILGINKFAKGCFS
jgi:hypothetical protein